MPKRALVLTDKQLRSLRTVGLYSVGGPVPGLAWQVTETPGNPPVRSWVLRAMVAGRRRALGLGPYPTVSLAAARERAEALHRDIRENRDPLTLKRQERAKAAAAAARSMTFQKAAEQYIEERRQNWKNIKLAQPFTFRRTCSTLGRSGSSWRGRSPRAWPCLHFSRLADREV